MAMAKSGGRLQRPLLSLDGNSGAGTSASSQPGGSHGFSVLEVTMMQMAIILGLGVLGLSFAFATMGWVLGLGFLLTSAAGAIYSGVWIARIVQHIAQLPGGPGQPRRYRDLGAAAFGAAGRTVVQTVQYTFLGGALVAVQLTASKALVQVIAAADGASTSQGPLCLWTANVAVACAMLPIMQVQRLADVTWTAFLGVAMILAPVAIFLYVVADTTSPDDTVGGGQGHDSTSLGFPPTSSFNAVANGITTIVFSYQGQTIFPELISQMRRPSEFPKAVVGAAAFMTAVYLGVGVFGYARLGASASYLVDYVDGLQGVDQGAIAAANAMLIINVMMGYTINGNVMNHALYDRIFGGSPAATAASGDAVEHGDGAERGGAGKEEGAEEQKRPRWRWAAVTALTLSVSFLLSNIIPSLGNLLSVLGATCGYALTFLFPAVFALRLLRRQLGWPTVALHASVVGLAAVAVVVGTYATGKTLISGIEGDVKAGAFSC